mgnify:CR=1 FL=1
MKLKFIYHLLKIKSAAINDISSRYYQAWTEETRNFDNKLSLKAK